MELFSPSLPATRSRYDPGQAQLHGDPNDSPGRNVPRRGGGPNDLDDAELCGTHPRTRL